MKSFRAGEEEVDSKGKEVLDLIGEGSQSDFEGADKSRESRKKRRKKRVERDSLGQGGVSWGTILAIEEGKKEVEMEKLRI